MFFILCLSFACFLGEITVYAYGIFWAKTLYSRGCILVRSKQSKGNIRPSHRGISRVYVQTRRPFIILYSIIMLNIVFRSHSKWTVLSIN